jgi:hypothetical protein
MPMEQISKEEKSQESLTVPDKTAEKADITTENGDKLQILSPEEVNEKTIEVEKKKVSRLEQLKKYLGFKEKLDNEAAIEAFDNAFRVLSSSELNEKEKKVLDSMKSELISIATNALISGNAWEVSKMSEWAYDANINNSETVREAIAKVYFEAAKQAEESGFNSAPIKKNAEFFKGLRDQGGQKRK